jgi:hypothetical protein
VFEYHVGELGFTTIADAAFAGRMAINNSNNTGDRLFWVSVYRGNGIIELSDFHVPAQPIGSFTVVTSARDFTFNARRRVQELFADGAEYIGVRVMPINYSAPSVFSSTNLPTLALVPALGAKSCPPFDKDCDGDIDLDDMAEMLVRWTGPAK